MEKISGRDYWNTYLKDYLKEGYIMVIQDVRGRWMSEGDFVDVRPFNPDKKTNKDIDEASDTYDAIDWLIKNIPHNNGKVGVFGISYPGFYSTMAAASNHPALVAVSPQAPVTNWFIGDDFHHNGAFFLMDAFSFYPAMGAVLACHILIPLQYHRTRLMFRFMIIINFTWKPVLCLPLQNWRVTVFVSGRICMHIPTMMHGGKHAMQEMQPKT